MLCVEATYGAVGLCVSAKACTVLGSRIGIHATPLAFLPSNGVLRRCFVQVVATCCPCAMLNNFLSLVYALLGLQAVAYGTAGAPSDNHHLMLPDVAALLLVSL